MTRKKIETRYDGKVGRLAAPSRRSRHEPRDFASGGILGLLALLTDSAEVSSKMMCETRKASIQLHTWESFHVLLEHIHLTGDCQIKVRHLQRAFGTSSPSKQRGRERVQKDLHD